MDLTPFEDLTWFTITDNGDGTCTWTDSAGQTILIPVALKAFGHEQFGTPTPAGERLAESMSLIPATLP